MMSIAAIRMLINLMSRSDHLTRRLAAYVWRSAHATLLLLLLSLPHTLGHTHTCTARHRYSHTLNTIVSTAPMEAAAYISSACPTIAATLLPAAFNGGIAVKQSVASLFAACAMYVPSKNAAAGAFHRGIVIAAASLWRWGESLAMAYDNGEDEAHTKEAAAFIEVRLHKHTHTRCIWSRSLTLAWSCRARRFTTTRASSRWRCGAAPQRRNL